MPLRRLSETRFRQVVAVFLILFAILGFWIMKGNRDLAQDGKEAHDALCITRNGIEKRIYDQSQRNAFTRHFLFVEHKNDKIILTLPRKVWVDSYKRSVRSNLNDLSTYRALKLLDCVPPPEPAKTENG